MPVEYIKLYRIVFLLKTITIFFLLAPAIVLPAEKEKGKTPDAAAIIQDAVDYYCGNASISKRRRMVFPGLEPSNRPMTPVLAIPERTSMPGI